MVKKLQLHTVMFCKIINKQIAKSDWDNPNKFTYITSISVSNVSVPY